MKSFLFTLVSLLFFTCVSRAQVFNYEALRSTIITTIAYNDLGTNGTKVSSNLHNKPFAENDNSLPLPIGFKFNFVGDTFTTFVLNTNGVIKFGIDTIEANASKDALGSTHPSTQNTISLCNTALQATAATEYRYFTTGSVGSRICTIQFKGVTDSGNASSRQFNYMEFQIILYENTNTIDLVLGTLTPTANAATQVKTNCGIKAIDIDHSVFFRKPGYSNFNTCNCDIEFGFVQGSSYSLYPIYGHSFGVQNSVLATSGGNAGIIYRFGCFNVYPINVANQNYSYTIGKIPLNYDNSIKLKIRNIGKNNVYHHPISLDVKGANSYHKTLYIDTLLSGNYADVTFSGSFNTINKGVDTNIVSLAADDNLADNNDTTYQLVNDSMMIGTCFDDYEDDTIKNPNQNLNTTFEIATRFHTATPQKLVSVSPYFPRSGVKYKIYIYAANADTPQAKLYPTTGTGLTNTSTKYGKNTLTLTKPVVVVGDFFVVVIQENISYSLRLNVQYENPLRSKSFYYRAPQGSSITPTSKWIDFNNGTFNNNNYGYYYYKKIMMDVKMQTYDPAKDTVRYKSCSEVIYKTNHYINSTSFTDTIKNKSLTYDSIYRYVIITITPVASVSVNSNISGCNSVIYKSKVYTASTIVQDTVKSYLGCDSIYNIVNIVVNKGTPITNNIVLSGCNSLVYKSAVYTSSSIVRDTIKSYQGCDSIYNIVNITIHYQVTTADTSQLYGCSSVIYKGNVYTASIMIVDTFKNVSGCDSFYHKVNINILTPANCGGNLVLDADSIYNSFSDTLKVRIKVKNGVDVFSAYAYLNYDTSLKLVSSKAGNYFGTQILVQPPVITGNKVDFGITQISGQQGANGDGIMYEFGFLFKSIPISVYGNGKAVLNFGLSNLNVYNVSGSQPASFTYLSSFSDTTSCNLNVWVDVWPGDLNNDKKVSVVDLLPIGYFYGQSGLARSVASIQWLVQTAALWGPDFTNRYGSGYRVFADGNGDGTISLADQATIGFNLNKYHAKPSSSTVIPKKRTFPNNVPVLKASLQDTVLNPSVLPKTEQLSISLGSATYPINNLYGIAFDIYFNPVYVNTSNITVDYTNSIFGTQNVNYTKIEDYSHVTTGKISIALTRFNATTISAVGGHLVNISLPIIANAPIGWFNIIATPIACNDNFGNDITIAGSDDSLRVGKNYYHIKGNFCYPRTLSNINFIQPVNVKLSSTLNQIGNFNNGFLFSNIEAGTNVAIRPSKNNDAVKANGVTSIDALLTQRHILNTTKLNSPYKIIAADVDGNKLVNSVDVLRMKRLILGTDTTFTKTVGTVKTDRLWEFVDSAYVFPDTTNPFPFKDSISFTNLTSNKINQTFIGVKLGDVNYDWNPAVARGIAVNSLELVYYVISTKEQSNQTDFSGTNLRNDELRMPVTSSNFNNIAALQTTLHFDNTKYEFVVIEDGKLQLDYNISKANSTGNIAILWTDKNAEAKSFDKDEVLFTIVLKPRSLGIGNLEFVVSNDMVETEAWDNNFTKHSIVLTQTLTNNKLKTTNNLVVYPNPAKDNITIESDGAKRVYIIDCFGRQVIDKEVVNNKLLIISSLHKGVYIVKAIMKNGTQLSSKLICL